MLWWYGYCLNSLCRVGEESEKTNENVLFVLKILVGGEVERICNLRYGIIMIMDVEGVLIKQVSCFVKGPEITILQLF